MPSYIYDVNVLGFFSIKLQISLTNIYPVNFYIIILMIIYNVYLLDL